jgi:hypothetical protein
LLCLSSRRTSACHWSFGHHGQGLPRPAERIVGFYNHRGTCEQWVKEGKGAIKWTRLSCRAFAKQPAGAEFQGLLREVDGAITATVETLQTSDLPDGDATVRVEHSDYSDVNYKHGMAITDIGHRRIVQFFPSFPASISPVLLRTHDRRGSRPYFFGVRSRRMHYATTGVLAAAMALVMVLRVAVDWPFRGEVSVAPEPFKAMQENIKEQQ